MARCSPSFCGKVFNRAGLIEANKPVSPWLNGQPSLGLLGGGCVGGLLLAPGELGGRWGEKEMTIWVGLPGLMWSSGCSVWSLITRTININSSNNNKNNNTKDGDDNDNNSKNNNNNNKNNNNNDNNINNNNNSENVLKS
ncbi:hypothetical protein PoB_007642800 [Plakobranchus ocellatus]|uniref:Uncharacterized protein n=1 Tax=Plakobranchus ocellatus TaxID=259542 RepID=A0AAV4E071_9GAST|nr:hypothetical protein PoB_007642800 [Plakobranchus ocellatus]